MNMLSRDERTALRM